LDANLRLPHLVIPSSSLTPEAFEGC